MGNVFAKAAEICGNVIRSIQRSLEDTCQTIIAETIRFSINHPRAFKVIAGTAAGAMAAAAVSPIVLLGFMPALGFTAGGIAAGSLAAAWQSSLGSISAGSLFAILQSAGAGGSAVPLVVGALTAAGGVSGAAAGAGAGGDHDKPEGLDGADCHITEHN